MLAAHSFIYLAGRVVAGLLGLASIAVFTRLLTPSEYGIYALIVAGSGLGSAVLFQWLRQGLVRFSTGDERRQAELLSTILRAFGLLILVTGVIAASAWAVFFRDAYWGEVLLILCLVAWAQAWFELNQDAARSQFLPFQYSLAVCLRAGLTLSMGALGAMFGGGVFGLLVGVAVAYISAAFLPASRVWRQRVPSRHPGRRGQDITLLISYGVPLSLTLALVFVVDSADRFMLAWLTTTADVGVYAAAYNLAQYSIGAVMVSISLGGYPLVVKSLEQEGEIQARAMLHRYLLLLVGVGLPAATGLAVLSPAAGKLLLGNYVEGTSSIVAAIVAIAILLGALKSYYFDVAFMLNKRTSSLIVIMAVSAISNIVLNFFLIPLFGPIGAAFSTLFAFWIALVLSFIFGRKAFLLPTFSADIAKLLVADAAMASILVLWRAPTTWPFFISQVAVGMLVYGVVLLALNPRELRYDIGKRARAASAFALVWRNKI